jgi:hypothetical protein
VSCPDVRVPPLERYFLSDRMAREKALQRADGTVMVILNQLSANLGQGQIALLGCHGHWRQATER